VSDPLAYVGRGACGSESVDSDPTYSDPTYSDPTYSDPTYSDPTYSDPTYSDPTYSDPLKWVRDSCIERMRYVDLDTLTPAECTGLSGTS
jgi:hypothetical protein